MVTSHWISTMTDQDAFGGPGPFVGILTGKPQDPTQWTVGTSNDECGTYHDGLDYTTSATFSGLVYASEFLAIDTSGAKPQRISTVVYLAAQVQPGTKFTNITKYKEHASDDASCVDDGSGISTTYTKYSGVQA